MTRRRLPTAVAAALPACLIAAACSDPVEDAPPPNLVLIVIDTLRADRLPFYGCPRDNAPFLSELAEEGLLFDRAYTPAPWTVPSTASLFTSVYPAQHGVIDGFDWATPDEERDDSDVNIIPHELETIAEALKRRGYRTFGVSANALVGHEIGYDRGFDRFIEMNDVDAEAVREAVRSFEDELKQSDRFFLYLHYFDPHHPYHVREPWFDPDGLEAPDPSSPSYFARLRARVAAGEVDQDDFRDELPELLGMDDAESLPDEAKRRPIDWMLAAYDSSIAYLDHHMRSLFEDLGLLDDDTAVVVTVDHGEEFLDRGGFGHGQSVHDEQIRATLILRLPGPDRPRGRVHRSVSTIDVPPTLRELAGLGRSPQDQGVSLLDDTARDRALLSQEIGEHRRRSHEILGFIQDGYKLMLHKEDGEIRDRALFRLDADPLELRDLFEAEPARAQAMMRALDEWLERAPRWKRTLRSTPYDPEIAEHMRAIGYTGK